MDQGTILVTGGAGYIGSHTVLQLRARGERVVVLDNLYTGFRQSVLDTPLIVANVGRPRQGAARRCAPWRRHGDALRRAHHRARIGHRSAQVLRQQYLLHAQPPAVLPGGGRAAFRVLLHRRRVRHPVRAVTRTKQSPTAPINPYGTSKLMSEWMLRDLAAAIAAALCRRCATSTSPARIPDGRIGQSTREATLLIKVACEAAVGKRPHVSVFGTDYPTPDGTGVRDYIHVEDLATAHLKALDYLRGGGAFHDAQLRLRPRLQRPRGARERRADQRPPAQGDRIAPPRRRSADPGRPRRPDPLDPRLAPAAGRPGHDRAHLAAAGSASCSESPGKNGVAQPAAEVSAARQQLQSGPHALAPSQIPEQLDAARPGADRRAAAVRARQRGPADPRARRHGARSWSRTAWSPRARARSCSRRSPRSSAPRGSTRCSTSRTCSMSTGGRTSGSRPRWRSCIDSCSAASSHATAR